MGVIDWGMIGAIATIGGIAVTIIIYLKQKKTNNQQAKKITQKVKGLFVINNEIKQEVKDKD